VKRVVILVVWSPLLDRPDPTWSREKGRTVEVIVRAGQGGFAQIEQLLRKSGESVMLPLILCAAVIGARESRRLAPR